MELSHNLNFAAIQYKYKYIQTNSHAINNRKTVTLRQGIKASPLKGRGANQIQCIYQVIASKLGKYSAPDAQNQKK